MGGTCSLCHTAGASGEYSSETVVSPPDEAVHGSGIILEKAFGATKVVFDDSGKQVALSLSSRGIGIGLRLGRDEHNALPVVKSVTEGGTAHAQGVQEGWGLIEVDGRSTLKITNIELEELVCGPWPKFSLSMQSIFDVFDDFRMQVPLLQLYCDPNVSQKKAQALAEKAAELAKKPEKIPEYLANVNSNLQAVEPVTQNTIVALRTLLKHIDAWDFQKDGGCDNPPMLKDESERDLQLALEELHALHILSWIHHPPKYLTHSTFYGITGEMTRVPTSQQPPFAIITVGAPGSGKSFMINSEFGARNWLKTNRNGPAVDSYVEVDPDTWITKLCNNDNTFRLLASNMNLENFFLCMGQRQHLIFSATGKNIRNTAGRVTARLKQAGYKIYYAIVLVKYETCMERIEGRFKATGRNVPKAIVQDQFRGLQESVPMYIKNKEKLSDGILIYVNEDLRKKPDPIILNGGDDSSKALEIANAHLAMPAT